MAGTVTKTESVHTGTKKVVFAWTSSAGGAADATSDEVYEGKVIGLTTIPDGTDVPLLNYDVEVKDAGGHDILLGAGANRSDSATQHVAEASLGAVAGTKLTLAVTNAGNAKKGTVIVWIR